MSASKSNPVLSVIKITLMTLWILIVIGPAAISRAFGWEKVRRTLIRSYFQLMVKLLGMKLEVTGEFSKNRPLLLVSNHASYADVFVLGHMFPVSFTPKREVRSWPVVGWLCEIGDCIFVERTPRAMKKAQEEMQQRLTDDKVLVIFPEGTTNDGNAVKGFKSGFFELAAQTEPPLPVQPVTITYTHSNGQPIPKEDGAREHIAWVGDADFFSHFFRLLGLKSITVRVVIGEPKQLADFESRKELCKSCEDEIGAVLQQELTKIA